MNKDDYYQKLKIVHVWTI